MYSVCICVVYCLLPIKAIYVFGVGLLGVGSAYRVAWVRRIRSLRYQCYVGVDMGATHLLVQYARMRFGQSSSSTSGTHCGSFY